MPPDDASLVLRARTGDADAYAVLLTRHRARLLRTCARMADENAAADIAQEAALIAWLQLDRLREPQHFGLWLVGIGRTLALRASRERARRRRWIADGAAAPD